MNFDQLVTLCSDTHRQISETPSDFGTAATPLIKEISCFL